MKTLLILTDADFVGGAETNYTYILPSLQKNGWNPVFITSGDKNISEYFRRQQLMPTVKPLFRKYFSFSVNGRVSPVNIFRTWRSLVKNRAVLKGLMKEYRPQAIVSNSMVSHWLLSAIKSDAGCKKIMHLHDLVNTKKAFGLYGRGLQRIAAKMDTVIVVSEPVRSQLPVALHNKIVKIYNPVKLSQLPAKTISKPLRIGMFARYTEWKGHRDFLRIAQALAGPEYEFTSYGNIAGNEAYFRQLQELAGALPNHLRIQLNGFSHHINREMATCDIILQLSKLPDPAPRVLIESNACGVPVFAYEGGGVKELFSELGLAGVIVPMGNLSAMIEAIKKADTMSFVFPDLKEITPEKYFTHFEKVLYS